jgi:2-keto-4-pentenoate hydratase
MLAAIASPSDDRLRFDEFQQVRIDEIRMGGRHAMWQPRIGLERAFFQVERLLQGKAEAEIAVVLGRDIDNPNPTMLEIIRAVDYVLPAIEICDSRILSPPLLPRF